MAANEAGFNAINSIQLILMIRIIPSECNQFNTIQVILMIQSSSVHNNQLISMACVIVVLFVSLCVCSLYFPCGFHFLFNDFLQFQGIRRE